ncbi:MAG TPA: SDR family NAD(P)-dependent oxidoreductase [Acidimicrobiales bacterium]|nr:SDR family NAD(P)-dependent oxidoreductase [Acidimicrobiales bacterium]
MTADIVTADRQKVAVVTGGGGGIGAAVAAELGRGGWFVVTVDPLVTLDGSARLPAPEETTAGHIRAAGGSARASSVSVTDGDALHELFLELADERGGLDAVVNVAGITRPTTFAKGSEEDWLAVLSVHLGGYLNVLEAALPIMAAAGHGRILGVTSGSGWRSADAGAYSCAKRAVAALTWQLGRCMPAGVTVNAMSPIAATRMVTEALERARRASAAAGRTPGTGGLSLSSMPAPDDLGPIGAHLAGDGFGWCNGRVLFAGGSEVAVIDEPRLLEVVRTGGVASLAALLQAVVPGALSPAEAAQGTTGGGNPRFGAIFDEPVAAAVPGAPVRSCAVVSDRPGLAALVTTALESRSVLCHTVEMEGGFGDAVKRLNAIVDAGGPLDAVVVAPSGGEPAGSGGPEWESVLASHRGIVERLHADAAWARAAAEYAAEKDHPVRLVTLTDGRTPGGSSRAQASAQLARAAATSTGGRVAGFAVSLEAAEEAAGSAAAELVAYLLGTPDSGLAGAELVVDADWLGLRSHPRPIGSVIYGGPTVPGWLDRALRNITGVKS